MAQKILNGRSSAPALAGEMVEVSVDQIVLARAPMRAFNEALAAGLKKTSAEVAVAYDGRCVTGGAGAHESSELRGTRPAPADELRSATSPDMLLHGIHIARAGVGFPGPVHLERFASPARLCVTDEPRLAGVGGIGLLTLVVPPASLAQALARGSVLFRPPVSIQVLLAGRLRPFVCARDVALELLRRGLADVVRRVEEACGAPVVIEFAGPSARSLSVGDRSVLASLAPQLGAAAALFVSDERTEVFLRDQRRSKAHRALAPDAGAPCEEVVNVDLGAVDPLILDEEGQVRAARDLAGRPVSQVLLGGDSGATLRDLFAAATLLKSKRVPPRLDFLCAVPSRQMLEVLASTGALTDLIATGARLIEPDARVASGVLYPPPQHGVAMRTCDPEPRVAGRRAALVASAETIAFAVATGEVGDPRAFKRPVRVTVPRALPTDDVLVARKPERSDPAARRTDRSDGGARAAKKESVTFWSTAETLELVDGVALAEGVKAVAAVPSNGHGAGPGLALAPLAGVSNGTGMAIVCTTLDEVREVAGHANEVAATVRAVIAPYIPSGLVALLSAAGIAALRLDAPAARGLKGQKTIAFPHPSSWVDKGPMTVVAGGAKLPLTWLARGAERSWATGTPKPSSTRIAR
ncbi:MAG: aconitase family protein [Myxococcota bacterium]|nr:aconitase family protein [Myxococcota bacterium]